MERYTLGKHERLKSRKELAKLFSSGQSFGNYPLRLIWREREVDSSEEPVLFGVSIPKKKFPKAVHRNQLKRLVREAYRQHKPKLLPALRQDQARISFFIIYVAKEPYPFPDIDRATKQLIERFLKKWQKKHRRTNPSS